MLRAGTVLAVALLTAGCSGAAILLEADPSLPRVLLGPLTSSILVEVGVVAGRMPDEGALDHLRVTLADVTGKPVAIAGPAAIPPQGGDYGEDDLRRIHESTGFFAGSGGFLDGQRAVLHVLYLDGRMAGDDDGHRTLGRSLLDLGVIAIFRDTYGGAHRVDNGTTVPAVAEMDRHVLLHEVGHALGLVGNGVPMLRDHDAEGYPGHSRYPESVMYYHPPMTPGQRVSGPVSTTFDVDDLADLAAYRATLRRPD